MLIAILIKRGHVIIPSAPLIPENDPSVLFNTAGMQPLVPYLLGQRHPAGDKLADVQKCVRTTDIDDIGDNTHLSFFQMLGNWSLGAYFKEEAIKWSWDLLTDKGEGFGLDPKRLYVTVFAGDNPSTPESLRTGAPRDEESARIWQSVGVPANRIFYLPAENNWWSPGDNGPCGPDSEMFYDVTESGLGDLTLEQYQSADGRRDVVEIWNDVFMEYEKKDGKVIGKLAQKNVDTGAGLERLTMVLQGKNNVYDTDLFASLMTTIRSSAQKTDLKAERIVADHLRSAVFMIADGALPSNTDRGYVLRRLLRRAVRFADQLGLPAGSLATLAEQIVGQYGDFYTELTANKAKVIEAISAEENKFRLTLEQGLKELHRLVFGKVPNPLMLDMVKDTPLRYEDLLVPRDSMEIKGSEIFKISTTYGFPFEMCMEELTKIYYQIYKSNGSKNETYDLRKTPLGEKLTREFNEEMKKHQELSKAGAEQKFKGGLAGTGEMETKYHTATHLLLASLRQVLGADIVQKGSNITAERLRFDFNWPEKLSAEQIKAVEDLVNQKINEKIPVEMLELPKEEAKKIVTTLSFDLSKYGDMVKVYKIGSFSTEFCGGPHVTNTGDLGSFKITKEEAVAAGVRRIKAVLE
ncbi:MAG: Alanine-tRNA ligase [Candidatus Daviesbacteria bacterium GW2011_GWB1_41_5]|uniref:alanine--tRNA ligase n=1 Tax=Candidatus Daviesbacteria bacterium GW2011_GWB1_41_5 TaxID=1618429 RepID=A0A0G0ZDF9_9BACT|nr:MAG: Alanine-tRNA ligase [Candidatus Daviesbacteria bacterium GW2011_GWB1_41_5]